MNYNVSEKVLVHPTAHLKRIQNEIFGLRLGFKAEFPEKDLGFSRALRCRQHYCLEVWLQWLEVRWPLAMLRGKSR